MNTLLLQALAGSNQGIRPPVWLMRQAGRYMPSYQALRAKHPFLTLCSEPELITKVTLLPIHELNVDAAIIFSDILMVPKALGFHVRFEDHAGPIIDNPLKSPSDLAKFSLNPLLENLSFLKPAIQELKSQLKVPLIGFAGAPFTLASYLIEGKTSRDQKQTKKWAYQDPSSFSKIIHWLEEAIILSLKQQREAGCEALQLFDTWAGSLSEEHFQAWCLEPLTRIVKAVEGPLIYFCRGSSYLAEKIEKTGVKAISIDWLKPIHTIRTALPSTPLQGNLEPEALYLPKDQLIHKTKQILSSMHRDPAYIFNLGHGILPDVPYQNIKALVETVASYEG